MIHPCPNAESHDLMSGCPCGYRSTASSTTEHPLADWERDLLRATSPAVAYQPYDPDLICPKCGHEDVSTEWHPGHHIWSQYGDVTVARWDIYQDCLDWLLRTCRCCGYHWPEAPVDQDGTA